MLMAGDLRGPWIQIHNPLRLYERLPHHDPHPIRGCAAQPAATYCTAHPAWGSKTHVEDQLIAQVAARRWPVAQTKIRVV